jgi:ABC-2 type transport system permease protein
MMENKGNRKKLRKTSGNWGRFVGIFEKFFKTNAREKAIYFWVFGYPLIFMVMIGLGVGESETTFNVAIINYDSQPYGVQTNDDVIDASSLFLISLFNSSETNFTSFVVSYGSTQADESNAVNSTLRGDLDAVVILSSNFSETLLGFEPGSPSFFIWTRPDPIKKSVIPSVFQSVIDTLSLMYSGVEPVSFTQKDAVPATSTRFVDFIMPALVIAGVTVAIMNVAALFAEEREKGLLRRLETTPVPRYIVFLGGGAAQLAFSAIQSVILLLCTLLFGTQFAPNANWFLAFIVTVLTAFMCIGIGLIIAAIVKDANSAGGLAWVAILPLQMLSGAFGMTPTDGIPTTFSVRAMQKILISGLGFADVWFDMLAILLYGIGFLALGIFIYQKKSQV